MLQSNSMIVATIVLLIVTLLLLPLRLSVRAEINFTQLYVAISARLWGIKIFTERLFVEDGKLQYQGSINGTVVSIKGGGNSSVGAKLIKSVCIEEVGVLTVHRINTVQSIIAVLCMQTIFSTINSIANDNTNTNVWLQNIYTTKQDNSAYIYTKFYVTLLGFVYTLIKERI